MWGILFSLFGADGRGILTLLLWIFYMYGDSKVSEKVAF